MNEINERLENSLQNYQEVRDRAFLVYGMTFDRYIRSYGEEKQKLRGFLERLSKIIDEGTLPLTLQLDIDRVRTHLKSGESQ